MSEYIKESISKSEITDNAVRNVLAIPTEPSSTELSHGQWIRDARAKLKMRRTKTPMFALLSVFVILFAGSIFLFENMNVFTGPLYAAKIVISSIFAVSLGFILSIWWSTAARFDDKIKEAERLDKEYRELLLSFSDSLFDIINALNTLATNPPKPFIVATEFLLGEYIHTLQSQLQRYGDYVAGLGFDATAFLDEKIRIFEGIRERASLSIQDMPTELETLFVNTLSIDVKKSPGVSASRQQQLHDKLKGLSGKQNSNDASNQTAKLK